MSFSADGNLLIMSSCEDNCITHEYFDTHSLKSWSQQRDGKLLAVGNNKSIEQIEGFLHYFPKCITLVDQHMNEALRSITEENSSSCAEHPLSITKNLKQVLFEGKIYHLFPNSINELLSARNSLVVNTQKNWIRRHKIQKYSPFALAAAVMVAVIVGVSRKIYGR